VALQCTAAPIGAPEAEAPAEFLEFAMRAFRIALASAAAVVVAWSLAAPPVRAESVAWDFLQNDGGWTPSQARTNFAPSTAYLWKWVTSSAVTGGNKPHWYVLSQGVNAISPSVSWLTSPEILGPLGTLSATSARISISQNFLFKTGTSGRPISTGQLEYQLNGSGTWVGLPQNAYTSGGSVLVDDPVFGTSPFKSSSNTLQFVDQAAYVAPSYLTPTGAAQLPSISPGAAAFTGVTPGFSSAYIPSEAFLFTGSTPITSLQLRFSQLSLGSTCNCGNEGWNLRFVQVDFPEIAPPVPEPASLALGMTGLGMLVVTRAIRQRRHQRASRPSESP
jgi:hypothetical protein